MGFGFSAILDVVSAIRKGIDLVSNDGSIGAFAADMFGQMLDMAANEGQLTILSNVDMGTMRDAIQAAIYEEDDPYSMLVDAAGHEEAVGEILEEIAGQIEDFASDYREDMLDASGEGALD